MIFFSTSWRLVTGFGLGAFLTFCIMIAAIAQSTHTVKSGDTLDGIGKQYGVQPSDIATLNAIDDPNRIVPGLILKIPPSPNAPKTYVVKSGDTLGSIAIAYGVSVADLSTANKIDDPKSLRVDQELTIPPASASASSGSGTTPDRYPLNPSTKRLLDAMPANKTKWKYVVVHHSASKNATLQGMDMYHRQKRHMENGLAYHFVIGNGRGIPDGKIEIGNRWKRQIKGGHLASERLNEISIGICLVGNFEVERPTAAQMQSLIALVRYLNKRCGIPRSGVKIHKQINTKPTACPGKLFPTETLIKNL
jgi:LysM repeat protein